MAFDERPFAELLSQVIDNRGRTCPTAQTGIPLIATNCIRNELLYPTYDKVRFVSSETYSTWFRGHPKPGDILFVNKATPGRVCLVPDPVDFCIAQDMVAVRADSSKIYPKYLFAALRSPLVQERIKQMHVGSLIPHFKKGDFDKLRLPVPSPRAQEFIGDIYFELSAKIDINRRMNETLEATARTLFKDWFIDFGPVKAKIEGRQPPRLSPELAAIFPDTLDEHGLPQGWKMGTVHDIADLNPESWSKKNSPLEIDYVDLANTKWGVIESTTRFAWADAPSRAQRILRPGDTIVGTVRPGNGSYSYVSVNGLTGSTGFAILRPRYDEVRELAYLAATSSENIERLSHLADGGAYPAVRPEVVSSTPIIIPDQKVVSAFSKAVSPLIANIEQNKHEATNLASLRDLLLPKLISGELGIGEVAQMTGAGV